MTRVSITTSSSSPNQNVDITTTLSLALTPADVRSIGDAGRTRFAKLLSHMEAALHILPDKPEETPASALRALWHLASGRALSVEAACDEVLPEIDTVQRRDLEDLITRRVGGEPLAHLTGRQRFMGLELLAGPQALIPRRETELLGNAVVNKLKSLADEHSDVAAIDVCTGCGNLAIAMAHYEPRAKVYAADLSEDAVALAQRNVLFRGLQDQVQVRCGDLLAPFDETAFYGRVDLLVCNPPYISSGKLETLPSEIISYEPRLAFDGGPFGVRILQRLMREAPRYLRFGGWLAFEVGLGQGPAVQQWLNKTGGYDLHETVEDSQGQTRVVMARVAS